MPDADADRPAADEVARLRAENDALNEQIKLLVKTEQRLYRSRAELAGQLERIRALGAFTLGSTAAEEPGSVVERSLRVLHRCFELDCVIALDVDAANGRTTVRGAWPADLTCAPAPPVFTAEDWRWVRSLDRATVLTASALAPSEALRGLATALVPALEPGGAIAYLPLRVGGALVSLIIAYGAERKRTMLRQDLLDEHHAPFLQLFTSHVQRAMESAALTQQLVHARKMEAIGQLAGGIAHDFNNLLTIIVSHTTLAQRALGEEAPGRENLDHVVTACEQAAAITKQLLALGRKDVQRRQSLDLNQVARSMARMLRRAIGETISLELDVDPSIGAVIADAAQVEQVTLNLVVNGRDAMPDGGVLKIATRPAAARDAALLGEPIDPSRFVALDVTDSGLGIDEQTRARIFEPFFTTKDAGRGTGLGLAVVYGIVSQSEGHIAVASTPGAGSRFTVLWPRSDEVPADAAGSAAPPEVAEPAPRAATILVAEDEEAIRSLVAFFLREVGYTVLEARDGTHALQIAGDLGDAIDLLISDLVMPGIGGLRLAAMLRERRPELLVLYMSGYSTELIDAQRTGELDLGCLSKPFTPEALLERVADGLATLTSTPRRGGSDRAAPPSRRR